MASIGWTTSVLAHIDSQKRVCSIPHPLRFHLSRLVQRRSGKLQDNSLGLPIRCKIELPRISNSQACDLRSERCSRSFFNDSIDVWLRTGGLMELWFYLFQFTANLLHRFKLLIVFLLTRLPSCSSPSGCTSTTFGWVLGSVASGVICPPVLFPVWDYGELNMLLRTPWGFPFLKDRTRDCIILKFWLRDTWVAFKVLTTFSTSENFCAMPETVFWML